MQSSFNIKNHNIFGWFIILFSLSLTLNIIAWLSIAILPDEAYYWVWSQRLELSYYDHPPLVAWVIRPFSDIFGINHWAIRFPAVMSWSVGSLLAYDMGQRIYNRRSAGFTAVLVWISLPIIQVGFHIVTPDSPMILFTWASYYFAFRAINEKKPVFWYATGAAVGLTVLAKYPGVLVAISLFSALLFSNEGRRYLLTLRPWLATLIALLVCSPVIFWNYQHDWISFAFQFGHGVKQDLTNPLSNFSKFFGGQMVVAMPWTLIAMVYAGLTSKKYNIQGSKIIRHFLLLGFGLPLILFGIAGFTSESGANWPVTAYVPGTLLLAGAWSHWLYPAREEESKPRRFVLVVVIFAFLIAHILVNLIRFPHWLEKVGIELLPQRTQISQAYGWDAVELALNPILKVQESTNAYGGSCIIVANKLQTASMIAFILKDARRVTVTKLTRTNQFHFWQQEHAVPREQLCIYFEQFRRGQTIPDEINLPEQGEWYRIQVLEVRNPDLSTRRFGFYLPRNTK